MGQVASELLARVVGESGDAPPPEFTWTSAPLGPALVDLEDKEAVRRLFDADRREPEADRREPDADR